MATPVSLRTIRRNIGLDLGDMTLLEATDDGDTNRIVDANNLYIPTNAAAGRILYVMSGPDIGKRRVVVSNSQPTFSITFNPALDNIVTTGTEFELWNRRGQGFDPVVQVNAQINNAIRKACDYAWITALDETVTSYDYEQGWIPKPTDSRGVYRIDYGLGYEYDDFSSIPRAREYGAPGWEVIGDRIWINGDTRTIANERALRIHYYMGPSSLDVLEDDTDTVNLPLDWIVLQVKAALLEVQSMANPQDGVTYSRWQLAQQAADKRLGMVGSRQHPDAVIF